MTLWWVLNQEEPQNCSLPYTTETTSKQSQGKTTWDLKPWFGEEDYGAGVSDRIEDEVVLCFSGTRWPKKKKLLTNLASNLLLSSFKLAVAETWRTFFFRFIELLSSPVWGIRGILDWRVSSDPVSTEIMSCRSMECFLPLTLVSPENCGKTMSLNSASKLKDWSVEADETLLSLNPWSWFLKRQAQSVRNLIREGLAALHFLRGARDNSGDFAQDVEELEFSSELHIDKYSDVGNMSLCLIRFWSRGGAGRPCLSRSPDSAWMACRLPPARYSKELFCGAGWTPSFPWASSSSSRARSGKLNTWSRLGVPGISSQIKGIAARTSPRKKLDSCMKKSSSSSCRKLLQQAAGRGGVDGAVAKGVENVAFSTWPLLSTR